MHLAHAVQEEETRMLSRIHAVAWFHVEQCPAVYIRLPCFLVSISKVPEILIPLRRSKKALHLASVLGGLSLLEDP